jgi:hypothetical protein
MDSWSSPDSRLGFDAASDSPSCGEGDGLSAEVTDPVREEEEHGESILERLSPKAQTIMNEQGRVGCLDTVSGGSRQTAQRIDCSCRDVRIRGSGWDSTLSVGGLWGGADQVNVLLLLLLFATRLSQIRTEESRRFTEVSLAAPCSTKYKIIMHTHALLSLVTKSHGELV